MSITMLYEDYRVEINEEKRNSIVYIDNVKVVIENTLINAISVHGYEKDFVAILLALIKYHRNSNSINSHSIPKRPNKDLIKLSLLNLLDNYPIEDLIETFSGLKYHEIEEILNAPNSSKIYKEFI